MPERAFLSRTSDAVDSAPIDTEIAGGSSSEIDLRQIYRICVSKWRTIAAATAATVFVALFYGLVATPSYRATAKILIDLRQQRVLASEEVLPSLNSDASAIETQVQLLTSGRVAQRVLRELEKRDPADLRPFTDLQVQDFLSRLTVARKGLTYVVDVTYAAPDPRQSADIANSVAHAYIAEESQAIADVTQRANTWLQERIKNLAPEVMALEKSIHEYRVANGLIAVGEQSMSERNLVDYIAQLGLARAAMAEAEAKLDLDKSKSSISLQSRDAFEVAKAKVAIMERGLRVLTTELATHRLQAIQLLKLEREAVAAKSLYESLLKRQRETEAQQSMMNVNARVVQEALPPTYPSWPRKSLLLAAGLLLGLTIGVLSVVGDAIRSRGVGRGWRWTGVARKLRESSLARS
jgi:succinoglycan biosynthesis transport protein ExoP